MHGRISVKLVTITHYQVYMTRWHFQGHGFKGQGHRRLSKNTSVEAYQSTVLHQRPSGFSLCLSCEAFCWSHWSSCDMCDCSVRDCSMQSH